MPVRSRRRPQSAPSAPSSGAESMQASPAPQSNAQAVQALQQADGTPGALPYQAELEARFDEDLGGVSAIFGAVEALESVGADAAAVDEQVLFADTNPDLELVAHEVAHVLQARNGGSAGGVGAEGGAAEQEADEAARRVARGEDVRVEGSAEGQAALHSTRKSALVTGHVEGHASPVWRSAASNDAADEENQALSEERARVVEEAFEQIFDDFADDARLGTPRYELSTRGRMTDTTMGSSGVGSSQTLDEAGGDRSADDEHLRRTDLEVMVWQGTEQISDEEAQQHLDESGRPPLASCEWTINFDGGFSLNAVFGGKYLPGWLQNEETGHRCRIHYTGFGAFFSLGGSPAKLSWEDLPQTLVEGVGATMSTSDSSATFRTDGWRTFADFDCALASMGEASVESGYGGYSASTILIKGTGAGPIVMTGTTFGVPGAGVDLTGGMINVFNDDQAHEEESPSRMRDAKLELVHGDWWQERTLFDRGSAELRGDQLVDLQTFVKDMLYIDAPERAPWRKG